MAGMLRVLALLGLASLPALAEDLVVTLGKQRGAASPLQWEVREAGHPLLGPIRFAFLKAPVTTAVGDQKISSNIYLSCETTTRKMAVELTGEHLRELRVAEVVEQDLVITDGKVEAYRTKLKVSFKYEGHG